MYDTANLVPNVTAELYFMVQLLTARGIAPEKHQDDKNGNKTIQLYNYNFNFIMSVELVN